MSHHGHAHGGDAAPRGATPGSAHEETGRGAAEVGRAHGGAGGHAHGETEPGHGHAHGGAGGHGHAHGHGETARSTLLLVLCITGSFLFVEAAVGYWSGSLALLADAGHMLADSGALVLALIAQHFALRPRTAVTTFGSRRAEVLAAFVNGMLLTAVAAVIVKEAAERWFSPVAIRAEAVLGTATAGLAVNLLVAWILVKRGSGNVNVRAALAHVLSDALGSVGAILAGLCVYLWGWQRADSVLSALIAVLVALSGFRIMRETASILLEGAPPHLDVRAIERTIRATSGVVDVHDLHVWRISERFDVLTAHVVIARGRHGTEMCKLVAERLQAEHGIEHVTIQPEAEPPNELVAVRRSRDGGPLGQEGLAG